MKIKTEKGTFDSHNQTDRLVYTIKTPIEVNPVGVVLLLHGMGSHAGRYESFADLLCQNGYVTAVYDQAGHGESVGTSGIFGSFAEKDGDVTLVKDFGTLVSLMRRRYRHLPFFVYAHSLGSFVARSYLAANPEALDGAVFSGTCERIRPPFLLQHKLKKLVKKAGRTPSEKVEALMIGDYSKAYPEPGGWVTTNPDALPKKGEDPYFGHRMCADAYYDMFKLMLYISGEEWLRDYPKGMPTLFLSGERDPLGGCGEGIRALCSDLDEADASDVSCRIYKGEKHETLGSLSDATVKSDILLWLKEKTENAIAMRNTAFYGGQTDTNVG